MSKCAWLALAVCISCTSEEALDTLQGDGESEPTCQAEGLWEMSYVFDSPACDHLVDVSGFTDTYDVSFAGGQVVVVDGDGNYPTAGQMDLGDCTGVFSFSLRAPETAETYGISLDLVVSFSFEAFDAAADATYDLTLHEGDIDVAGCSTTLTGSGIRI